MNKEKLDVTYAKVSMESEYIKKIIDSIVIKYSKELDEFVAMVRAYLQLIKEANMQEYTDEDLQMQIIKLPTLLYFVGNGLEDIGADSEMAEYMRKELYNEAVNKLSTESYTILDKKSIAGKESETEEVLSKIYDRAYKKLKLKIDHATKLLESMKKVLDIRAAKINRGKGGDEQVFPNNRGGFKDGFR